MGRRGGNAFKRNDAIRALQSARDGGIDPAALEVIVAVDGAVTFRVLGDRAAPTAEPSTRSGREWDDEIAKLKATPTKGERPMTRLHLKYVQSFGGYHYFRRRGSPRISLPGVVGSAEFMAAYQDALAGAPVVSKIGAERTISGTISALVVAYYGSAKFKHELGAETRRYRRNVIEKFRAQFGKYAVKGLQRHHLVELADRIEKPHARRNWFKAVRGLLQYAVEIGMRLDDPTSALKIGTLPKTDGFRTWSEPDIMAFRQHHAIGTRARLAFELLLNTGQRRGDVIRMGRQHLHGGKLTVRQSKTGTTLKIPIRSELAAVIEATPADNLTFLTTAFGKPFAPAGFRKLVPRDVRRGGPARFQCARFTQGRVPPVG